MRGVEGGWGIERGQVFPRATDVLAEAGEIERHPQKAPGIASRGFGYTLLQAQWPLAAAPALVSALAAPLAEELFTPLRAESAV
jgi:hypothetical protein